MINIRKEQKIAIPQEYLEQLKPNYVFIPIKENKNYPKTLVKKDDLIEDIKVPITGNILATAVNKDKRYLIIKNSHLDEANKDETRVSKNSDKKKEKVEFLEKRWLYKSCRYLKKRNEIFSSFLFFLELLRGLVLMILRF